MKKLLVLAVAVGFLLGFGGALFAQPAGTMYTLGDIYYYLLEGMEAEEGGSLEPPAGAVPGDTRFKTLKQIYEGIEAEFGKISTTAENVEEGVTFWSTDTAAWGVQTGTLAAGGGLLKTGQITSYRTGDDGTYQKGTAKSYTDNGDGTITDNVTGLMWAKDGNGAGCNNGATLTWNAAIDWAEGLTFATHSDWRLPNAVEIMTLMVEDAGQGAPYINTTYFPNTVSDDYWSSTSRPSNTDSALCANFSNGLLDNYNKTNSTYVRAVRGGE